MVSKPRLPTLIKARGTKYLHELLKTKALILSKIVSVII